MRGVLVALDLETTGLDVENDSIIEIGAVRLEDGQVIDEYSTLVNPGFVIPAETTHITGIHQDDLRNAPLLTDVLSEISQFVGEAPVIAHNVSFDISFMRRYGVLKNNLPIDTYELATILLPSAPRYSLSGLTQLLEIELENAHRALDDARATALLYWALWEKALSLPLNIIYEITRAMQPFHWETGNFFLGAYDAMRARPSADTTEPESVSRIFQETIAQSDPQPMNGAVREIDISQIEDVIADNGQLASVISHYEHRDEQLTMARHVTQAFNQHKHLLLEAGTGTGKSIAYLLPSILWATQNQQRVVISTNTINLQDQLHNNDIPLLRQALDVPFKAAVMKGRRNYLCPRRLDAIRRRSPANFDELRTLAKILVWLQETTTGDRSEITLRSGEFFAWDRMSAQDEGCTTNRCHSQMHGTCPFYKARQQAEAAHIVIANHALLISDTLTENRVLPDYNYVIIDEAHQLESAITNGMNVHLDLVMLLRRLHDIGGIDKGLLGDLLSSARNSAPEKRVIRLEAFITNVGDAVRSMIAHVRAYFSAIQQYLQDLNSGPTHRVSVDEKRRNSPGFAPIRTAWDPLNAFFDALIDAMQNLTKALQKLEKYDIARFADHQNSVAASARHLREMQRLLQGLSEKPDANTVYWLRNAYEPDYISVQSAPLNVGTMMEQFIWNKKQSAILTSATLRTAGTFDYIKERLYADNVEAVALGSPFDYRSSTLLFIPEDMPAHNDHNKHQKAVEKGLIELAAALQGRVLALFTNYSQLRTTAANISPRLALGNITVYDQATGGSRETLLDNFKSTDKAVLLGTRSFWEGVDIPGEDLSALVIVKLPFAVPSDPIFAARSATYNDPFMEYAVPDAILRFRQGFGRLIRTQTDRGIVTILDARITQKSYGRDFLESLPDCTVQYGQMSDLASAATNWLNQVPVSNEDEDTDD